MGNPKRTIIRYRSALIILALFGFLAAGCGKSGFPQPDDPKRKFTIAATNARVENGCLIIQAQLAGAYTNIEELRLDVEAGNLEDICLQCPFVPTETEFFAKEDVTFEVKSGALSFSYCPKPADSYRWRLSGISRFSSIPHAQSAVMHTLTIVDTTTQDSSTQSKSEKTTSKSQPTTTQFQ